MGQECDQTEETEDTGFSDKLRVLDSSREVPSGSEMINSDFRGLQCTRGSNVTQRAAPVNGIV